MQTSIEELSKKALGLPPEERARLAQALLASLHEGTTAEVDDAWDQEIKRRLMELEAGAAKLVPANEVFAEIRQMLK